MRPAAIAVPARYGGPARQAGPAPAEALAPTKGDPGKARRLPDVSETPEVASRPQAPAVAAE